MSTSDSSHPSRTAPIGGGSAPHSGSAPHTATASDRAYHWVKERVLDGRLHGGELISEGEVATETDMSRTPVREAFLRLEVEGLLRLYPKRGALIVPVSANEVADVTEARILLETFAATKAIETGNHTAVADTMAELLRKQRHVSMPGGEGEFSALDRQFHEALIDAAGNDLVGHFYAGLRDRQIRMFNSALQRVPARHAEILAEHAKVCALLRAGNQERLRAALTAHISGTHGALR